MKRQVAYLRVSTEAQTEKYGLDLQRQKITEYCVKNGIEITEWYVDGGFSGSKLARPAIQKLLEDAQNGTVGTVYVYKLDRVSRDTIDTLTLLYKTLPELGVKIVSMTEEIRTDNPMDKVMVTMNAAMNQYERETIRMRMSAGMVERVKRGLWMGGSTIPYGYYYDRNDGILHIKEKEAENIREMYRLYNQGYSCVAISQMLGMKGDRIVTQILKRKSNLGLIDYKGKVYKGLHEPIIDNETFDQTQELMKKRSKKNYIVNSNLLTGLCVCGKCGARVRYQKWGKYHALVCYSHYPNSSKDYLKKAKECDTVVKAEQVEQQVESIFKLFALKSTKDYAETQDNCAILEKQIEKLNSKIKKLYTMYIDNESENLLELIHEEEEKLKGLKISLSDEQSKRTIERKNERIDEIKSVADVWDSLTVKEKNKALKTCVDSIIVTRDNVDIHFEI